LLAGADTALRDALSIASRDASAYNYLRSRACGECSTPRATCDDDARAWDGVRRALTVVGVSGDEQMVRVRLLCIIESVIVRARTEFVSSVGSNTTHGQPRVSGVSCGMLHDVILMRSCTVQCNDEALRAERRRQVRSRRATGMCGDVCEV
jgi:hypothetical protein